MHHYNTWLFWELATRYLHQITSDKANIDRKRGKFAQNFHISFDITFQHNFDFIMSDSTDFELEIVSPNPVWAHSNSSVAQWTKENRKGDHSSSIDAETRARQPQNEDFYTEKGKLFCKFCFIGKDHSRQSVLRSYCIGDAKTKWASSTNGSDSRFIIYYTTDSKWAHLDNVIIISDWVRASVGSKLSLNAASSPLLRKFASKHIPSGVSIPHRNGWSLYLKNCYKSDKERLKSSFKNKEVMVFYDETTDSAARNVCVFAISWGKPTCFCQKTEELMYFWRDLLDVLNVSSPITTRSCVLTGHPLSRKQINNLCFYCNSDMSWTHLLYW